MTKSNSYFAYIRVSTTKQGEKGVSLQEQKSAIERYASRNNLAIQRWFEEQETAAKKGRPIFNTMLKSLKRGEALGVIIHKIDRSARNLKDWADLGDMIDLGVDVHFANESLDMSSRGGRLSADIQAVVAADYIRNLREETKKGFYGRLKQGLYPLPAPIGYLDKGKGEPKEIDPVRGPIVKRLFELYSTGKYSVRSLRSEASILGLKTRRGGKISETGISTMLHNPFYIGIIRIRKTEETFDGIHQPLIRATLFKKVQEILKGKTHTKAQQHDFVYRRLVQCAHCGYSLIGEYQKGHIYYRCHQKECPTKGIREETIDQSVESQLKLVEFNEKERPLVFRELERKRTEIAQEQKKVVDSCNLLVGEIGSKLNRLTDAFLDGDIGRELFHQRKEALLKERAELEERQCSFSTNGEALISEINKFLELAENASLSYKTAFLEEKRKMLKAITSNRLVDRKNVAVELSLPFSIMAKKHSVSNGPPSADTPRTWAMIIAELIKYVSR